MKSRSPGFKSPHTKLAWPCLCLPSLHWGCREEHVSSELLAIQHRYNRELQVQQKTQSQSKRQIHSGPFLPSTCVHMSLCSHIHLYNKHSYCLAKNRSIYCQRKKIHIVICIYYQYMTTFSNSSCLKH